MENKQLKLLNKFKKDFEFKVIPDSNNPNMSNSENMRHFKVFVINKELKNEESFIFSQGLGIAETDDENVLFGLISCFKSDLPYIDLEEFDGLGYEGKEAIKTYKSICDQHKKLNDLGFIELLENLSEDEQDLLD